jgi:MYXO-CTERM domain-containing protein
VSATAQGGIPLPSGAGVPITVPTDNVIVTLVLDHTSAAFTGNLYFLGSGDATTVLNPAPNSDPTNQGFFAFSNHNNPIGTTVELPGVFNAGDVLHFAYDIVAPSNASTDVLRTDVAGDRNQFAYNADPNGAHYVMVEDVYPGDGSDMDYNDIVFGLTFEPVPAPGALALLGLAGVLGRPRRRR